MAIKTLAPLHRGHATKSMRWLCPIGLVHVHLSPWCTEVVDGRLHAKCCNRSTKSPVLGLEDSPNLPNQIGGLLPDPRISVDQQNRNKTIISIAYMDVLLQPGPPLLPLLLWTEGVGSASHNAQEVQAGGRDLHNEHTRFATRKACCASKARDLVPSQA